MKETSFGSESLGLPPARVEELEQQLEDMDPGFFSLDERRVIAGLKSWDDLKNPRASQRAKRHQIRERIQNGLLDLLLAATLLPTEDWEAIVKADSQLPVQPIIDEPGQQFDLLKICIETLSSTLAYAADGVEGPASGEMDNALITGIKRYQQLQVADRRAGFIDPSARVECEWDEEKPLFQDVSGETPIQRFLQFRIGGASRRRFLEEELSE